MIMTDHGGDTVMNSGLYSVCGIEEICSWKDKNNEWGP